MSLPDVEEAVQCFLTPGVRVVSLNPEKLSDIWRDIRNVAAATGQQDQAESLIQGFEARLRTLADKTRHLPRPRVACLEWLDPLMAAGNWIPELVEIAGGSYGLVEARAHTPPITWDTLADYQPEVIVITPCGFKIPQAQADLPRLLAHPQWQALPAVRANRVYVADGNAYYNRPGPRIVESAEILAEMLPPGNVCRHGGSRVLRTGVTTSHSRWSIWRRIYRGKTVVFHLSGCPGRRARNWR